MSSRMNTKNDIKKVKKICSDIEIETKKETEAFFDGRTCKKTHFSSAFLEYLVYLLIGTMETIIR